MAKTRTKPKQPDASEKRRKFRQRLMDVLHSSAKESDNSRQQYSRQINYDDVFSSLLAEGTWSGINLLPPPYLPGRMYELYEQSGMLNACVEAYVSNIDGYGYNIASSRAEDDDIQTDASPEVELLKSFFDSPNDVESFDSMREKLRRDYEVTGNSYIEVVRSLDNKPALLFRAEATRMRLTTMRDPVIVPISVKRGRDVVQINAEKRFRSFCMLSTDGDISGPRVRYFKAFGDPRDMSMTTGKFGTPSEPVPPEDRASEVIHLSHGNAVYGIPRWIATLISVLGSYKAGVVNYDLFDNQGIPPLIITVAGGSLTEDSFSDLIALFRKAKGMSNFHKLLVLEAESDDTSIDGKPATPKLDVTSLAEYRKEDAMFLAYLGHCQDETQKLGFRLPGMFLGKSDDANFATAFIVRSTAEEQLFIPERRRFDEIINKTLVSAFVGQHSNLRYRSNGATLQSTEDMTSVLNLLIQSGSITINGLISFVNENYGMSLALYDASEEWANKPIPVGLKDMMNTYGQDPLTELPDELPDESVQKNQKIYAALQDIETVMDTYVASRKGCACAS